MYWSCLVLVLILSLDRPLVAATGRVIFEGRVKNNTLYLSSRHSTTTTYVYEVPVFILLQLYSFWALAAVISKQTVGMYNDIISGLPRRINHPRPQKSKRTIGRMMHNIALCLRWSRTRLCLYGCDVRENKKKETMEVIGRWQRGRWGMDGFLSHFATPYMNVMVKRAYSTSDSQLVISLMSNSASFVLVGYSSHRYRSFRTPRLLLENPFRLEDDIDLSQSLKSVVAILGNEHMCRPSSLI